MAFVLHIDNLFIINKYLTYVVRNTCRPKSQYKIYK